ncbi:hypothetical protein HDC91_002320 [Mucilaginibacter sp. AK015]|nr:hypothetical protein [Mucilaginibacter sp. AK015]
MDHSERILANIVVSSFLIIKMAVNSYEQSTIAYEPIKLVTNSLASLQAVSRS